MYNIIPQPVSILINQDEKGFTLHTGTTISPYPFVQEFISVIRKSFNKKVYVHEDTGEERSIILKLDESIEYNEGYTIKCENRRVFIKAKTETGLFYGLQTLKQMLLQTDGKLPYTEITDYPRFSYRGLMLDCEKNTYVVDEVKRLIDMMALHKMNVLRWKHNNYTQEEIQNVVKYCQDRRIKVILNDDKEKGINSNLHPYCLDYPYGINTLKKICNDDGEISDENNETLGLEASLRTRNVADVKKAEYYLYPRLGAISENAWAEKDFSTFSTFLHKAGDYYKLLDAYGVNYANLSKACPSFLYKYASIIKFKLMRKDK